MNKYEKIRRKFGGLDEPFEIFTIAHSIGRIFGVGDFLGEQSKSLELIRYLLGKGDFIISDARGNTLWNLSIDKTIEKSSKFGMLQEKIFGGILKNVEDFSRPCSKREKICN